MKCPKSVQAIWLDGTEKIAIRTLKEGNADLFLALEQSFAG